MVVVEPFIRNKEYNNVISPFSYFRLFGTEDVDLRTLNSGGIKSINASIRPITPPPPMISSDQEKSSWATLKGEKSSTTSPNKSNLAAVRAKLSDFSKSTSKGTFLFKQQTKILFGIFLYLFYFLFFYLETERKRRTSRTSKSDTEHRSSSTKKSIKLDDDISQDCTDNNIQIMMTQAQEQLDNKDIDIEEYGNVMKQIIEINESKKIREVQRRERIIKRRSGSNGSWQQNDLQPISDDEIGFSSTESDSDYLLQYKKQRAAAAAKTTGVTSSSSGGSSSGGSKFRKNKESRFSVQVQLPQPSPTSSPSGIDLITPIINKQIESSFAEKTAAELRNRFKSDHNRWSTQNTVPSSTITIPPLLQPNWENNPTNNWNNTLHQNNIPQISGICLPNSPWSNQIQTQTQAITAQQQQLQHSSVETNQKDDIMRTINIDGIPREIRFYEDVAIAFMNWDEPKEIGFQSGQRRIIIDDNDTIILGFNEPYKLVKIDQNSYNIRLGSPTRELYIDGKWYECFFGEPPIGILIDNKLRIFKLDGPPPQVKIGNIRTDLVICRINLIIDARNMVPIFIDSKVQYFEIDGHINKLQFADYLLTVIINDEPFTVEFGGLPKSLMLHGKKHFIRFTALPNGIIPGKTFVKNMVRTNLNRDLVSPPAPAIVSLNDLPKSDEIDNQLSVVGVRGGGDDVGNLNNLGGIPQTQSTNSILPGLDFLANLLPKQPTPLPSLENNVQQQQTGVQLDSTKIPQLNIDSLYQQLLASGILGAPSNTGTKTDDSKEDKHRREKEKMKPIYLNKPETIKKRQSAVVYQLYSGMQCSSCGVRFPPEQTKNYSQHLDWHFRQNRRDRDSARRAHSRRWYYDVGDWIQYEEIEDLEEREKNWFETQQTEIDTGNDGEVNQRSDSPPPSCKAEADDVNKSCEVCHDPFEQFYNEETEEWHLRPAVKFEEKTYHPLCLKDYQVLFLIDVF